MSTIIVGDVHGKLHLVQKLLQDKDQEIVFVGDYLDSFTIDKETQIRTLDVILDACQTRNNVTALLGNHELSYLDPVNHACSGFSDVVLQAVLKRKTLMQACLQMYTVVDGFLITHAGVSRSWLPSKYNTLDEVIAYINLADIDTLARVGFSRGGMRNDTGGILWCDSYHEFKPIKRVKQIFGHTQYRAPDQGIGIVEEYENNFNIDCLDRCYEVLEITDGVARIKTL